MNVLIVNVTVTEVTHRIKKIGVTAKGAGAKGEVCALVPSNMLPQL